MASNGKGVGEILSKVRVPKRTKEAVQMNEAYEPTQTALQYWDEVKKELRRRGEGYDRSMEAFRAKGGQGKALDDGAGFSLNYRGVTVVIHCDDDGRPTNLAMDIPVTEDIEGGLLELANAITACYGSAKNAKALELVDELRSYVESDGLIVGMNSLVNKTILQDPVLTAMSMQPTQKQVRAEE